MGLRDCLLSAARQGEISREDAERLSSMYEQEFAQLRLALGDDAAAGAARVKLEKQLRAEARERRRVVMLADAVQDRIAEYVANFKNLQGRPDVFEAVLNLIEHYGFAGTSSIKGRADAIISMAHGEMADVLQAFRRSRVTGRRHNRPLFDNVVREALGQPTGKPEAKAFAETIENVIEGLRQRFNAAGGAIGKLERYLPQDHDARALLAAGRDKWKEFVRPRLDHARMKDPLSGEPLTAARLEQSLDAAFDKITTDGWAKRTPSKQPFGRGPLAAQRAEHRFLHFKSADDWLAYNQQFGTGDPVRAVFGHINGIARDIASMEILGPNPNATMEWLKQIVQVEAGKAIAGQPSLYDKASKGTAGIADRLNYIPWRLDAVYQYVRGRAVVSNRWATGAGNVRNVLTSAFLGSASVLASTTDPFLDMAARYLSGMPWTKVLAAPGGILHAFTGATKMDVVRSGIIWDDFLHIMGDEVRYAGTLGGSEWSKWLADRTVTLFGLEPITQARKHVFARDFEAAIADNAGATWDKLNPYLKRTMEGYGLDRTAWDIIRTTPAFSPAPGASGFLRPIDVAARSHGPALLRVQKMLGINARDADLAAEQTAAGVRRIAEQYLEMILGQTERAVPTGSARSRSFVTAGLPRGSVMGELAESGLQFKSFALSFTTLQIQVVMQELHQGAARGAAYASMVAIGLGFGGAVALQIKNLANSKDLQPMDNLSFWLQAMAAGGGFGIMGDFLLADMSRHGHSLQETLMGPTVGLIADVGRITLGNAREALKGKNTNIGLETVNMLGRYTPIVGSGWATRAAYRRIFLDQLQYLLDPDAHKNWRKQEQKLARETRQGFTWRPGQMAPERLPQLTR